MRYLFSKRMKALSIVVFLIGTGTAILAYSINREKKLKPAVGFTMFSKQTITHSDGGEAEQGFTEVRYQKSDKSWKQVSTYVSPDGKVKKENITFGQVGRGVFQVDKANKVLHFMSTMDACAAVATDLRKDEHYVRDDSVLGYETQVLRFTEDDGSGYTDEYCAPDFQNLPIKSVSVSENRTSIIEPVQIQVGEPSEEEFRSLPDWPIRYDRYEAKIQAIENAGNHEGAEQMRQVLKQQRQQKPDR